jgi:hypothetical protein
MSVSQPSAATPLQSAKPSWQVPIPHCPAEQPAVPFATGGQTAPQAPQFVTSNAMSASHPFAALPSQSAWPGSHQATPAHTPARQAGAPFSTGGQAMPQSPQCQGSLATSTQRGLLSGHNFTGGGSQTQAPDAQDPRPQKIPQPPQLPSAVKSRQTVQLPPSGSQPGGAGQAPTGAASQTQAPDTQDPRPHSTPQPPQFGSLERSAQPQTPTPQWHTVSPGAQLGQRYGGHSCSGCSGRAQPSSCAARPTTTEITWARTPDRTSISTLSIGSAVPIPKGGWALGCGRLGAARSRVAGRHGR